MKKLIFLFFVLWIGLTLQTARAEDAATAQSATNPAANKETSYKIVVGDALDIQVYQEADLSGIFEVNEDGTISYPLLGSVKVGGTTVGEAEKTITELLGADYLVSPFVTLRIEKSKKEAEGQRRIKFTVLGAVQRPGTYTAEDNEPVTLAQAISRAGGFSDVASVNRVKIIRAGADGKKQVIKAKMKDILSGKKPDVELRFNDLITVPERFF